MEPPISASRAASPHRERARLPPCAIRPRTSSQPARRRSERSPAAAAAVARRRVETHSSTAPLERTSVATEAMSSNLVGCAARR